MKLLWELSLKDWAGLSRLRVPAGAKPSHWLWGPPSLVFFGFRCSVSDDRAILAWIWPPLSDEVKNEWSCTSTPLYVFLARTRANVRLLFYLKDQKISNICIEKQCTTFFLVCTSSFPLIFIVNLFSSLRYSFQLITRTEGFFLFYGILNCIHDLRHTEATACWKFKKLKRMFQ